ncbi:MAG: carbohydrate binding family 9 domain-containing protein [Candidatus Aminicenantes bacterium]|nr:carbohydrate binding family 9 domain-containing protein [Candidatus Aminicenantes bacterium]
MIGARRILALVSKSMFFSYNRAEIEMRENRTWVAFFAGLLGLLLLFSPSLGKSKGSEDLPVVLVPEFLTPPKIDGTLENPLWTNGAVIEDFVQFEPQEGAAPSEKTIAYFGYDNDHLYIAFRCFDSNPKAIRACLAQRDKVTRDDEVTVYLDTFNDRKRAFVFQVNPCGIQTDGVFTESTGQRGRGPRGGGMGFERFDRSWDTFFLADAIIDETGYTVEMAIPFKSLRFPHSPSQRWGLKIMRTIRRKNEEIYWPAHSRSVNGFLVQAGMLEIQAAVQKGKNLEIMPVVTALQESGQRFNPQAGLNLKWDLTSDITLNSTVNPDFSQVEADMPQVDVNQRYALYYPEKRPFFLEGKDYFDTPFELVYTRKIVEPQGGVKLSGKTKGFTIGFLSAVDERSPEIEVYDPLSEEGETDEEEDEDSEEPAYRALVNVFRLKKDLFAESYVGFIATSKDTGGPEGGLTGQRNRVAGVDGHFKFLEYNRLTFQAVGSLTRTRTESTGFVPATMVHLSHNSRHAQLSAEYLSIPPDFEASLGFFRRKDIRFLNARAAYAFLPQKDLIVSVRPSLEYRRIYDFAGTLTDDEYSASIFLSGWRQSHMWVGYTSGLERYNGRDFYPRQFRTGIGSEPFSWLSGGVRYSFGDGIYYSDDPYLGYKLGFEVSATLRPFSNLSLAYDFENNAFYKEKGGEVVYKINILSQRLHYQLSRSLSARLITDYNDYYKELYLSFLLSWEHRPGTVFYLGIDDSQEKDAKGIFRGTGRYYFVKFSYWWRV